MNAHTAGFAFVRVLFAPTSRFNELAGLDFDRIGIQVEEADAGISFGLLDYRLITEVSDARS